MLALSIRQPYAELILRGDQDGGVSFSQEGSRRVSGEQIVQVLNQFRHVHPRREQRVLSQSDQSHRCRR
jgi:hypothetical protein